MLAITPDIFLVFLFHFFSCQKSFHLAVLYGFLRSSRLFFEPCLCHKGTPSCSRHATTMAESKQSVSSCNSDSDGDGIAEHKG